MGGAAAGLYSTLTKPLSSSMSDAALHAAFDDFDSDHSGSIDKEEMMKMVRKLHLGFTDKDIKELMMDADPDGSGEIDFEEFKAVLKKQIKGEKKHEHTLAEVTTA